MELQAGLAGRVRRSFELEGLRRAGMQQDAHRGLGHGRRRPPAATRSEPVPSHPRWQPVDPGTGPRTAARPAASSRRRTLAARRTRSVPESAKARRAGAWSVAEGPAPLYCIHEQYRPQCLRPVRACARRGARPTCRRRRASPERAPRGTSSGWPRPPLPPNQRDSRAHTAPGGSA